MTGALADVPVTQHETELCQSCLGHGVTSTADGAMTCQRCGGGGYEPQPPAVDDEAES